MNRNAAIALIVILVLGAMGLLAYQSANRQTPTASDTSENTSQLVPTQTAEIAVPNKSFDLEEQNDSGQTGRVVLMDQTGKTRVLLSVDNEPEQASQPAHIHTGSCPTPGAVKYPLNDVIDGLSDTILDVSYTELTSQIPLAVNIHKSSAEINSYVACTDLTF
jgi:hypothetical protein